MKIEFDKVEVGQEIPSLTLPAITHANLVRYAGASGDFNPIHNDKDFAIANGLDGTIAHGMFVMALIGRACTNWVDQKQIKFFGVKFKAMTKLGSVLTCKGVIKKKKEENGEKLITLTVEAVDQNGEVKAGGDLIVACA
ncbi:MAG TPA: MaoC/PaaZ C-terminal domain-containing protein [Leptospiraceae bacterium]|nr:MaoC/PaaZ C-terminal domain-containing protein [Leptospiraceae bacterium]HMW05982.1 MaoC/PaaZ C-terminal domain-containing protein [Leptospiraceae bacterium]HMX32086.1 MaoC/PaaZ C-terminal domain-containing protein [Leptospiraceae bacterium]HMY32336.1 MaoC/PaaZ C-terminal domain-containing protein [Leptospiraceae bacterium]HMZ62462.1 MaoC/PaaZ C-terminal domain-containing protein [Leptospiraceae bacterium]